MTFEKKLTWFVILLLGVIIGSCNQASNENVIKGRQMLDQAVNALGGTRAFAKLASVQNDEAFTIYAEDSKEQGTSTSILIFPDQLYQIYRLKTDTSTLVIKGEEVWRRSSLQDSREIAPPEYAQAMRQAQWYSIVHLFANVARDSSIVAVSYKEKRPFAGRTVDVLDVELPHELGPLELYLSTDTRMPIGYRHSFLNSERYVVHYLEWQTLPVADGEVVKLPSVLQVYQNGKTMTYKNKSVWTSFNASVDIGQFPEPFILPRVSAQ